MENTIDEILKPTNDYLKSFMKNTIEGWWELEVGLPKGWVFNDNKEIHCELIQEKEIGNIIKIQPKNTRVIIDDLINFLNIIIETNKKIEEKEKEFTTKMEEMKSVLEKEAKKFYDELDELKVNSFKNINKDFENSISTDTSDEKKEMVKSKTNEKPIKKPPIKKTTTRNKTEKKEEIDEVVNK